MEFENKKLRDVADIAARIMMGEKALHPNQQKLDVHEPEKDELTAKDFEMLRNKKKVKENLEDFSLEEIEAFMVSEDFEQLDELSKQTLKSYRVKSIGRDSSFEKKGYQAAKQDGGAGSDRADQLFNKSDLVTAARKRAQEKMRKEDVESIEEGTPAKNTDVADKSYLKDMGKKPTVASDLKNLGRFITGKKETNEEVEELDEVSLKTATSAYVKRMGDDGPNEKSSQDKAIKTMDLIAKKHGVRGVARATKTADDKYGLNDPVHNPRKAFVKQTMANVKKEEVDQAAEFVLEYESKDGKFVHRARPGAYGGTKDEKHAVDTLSGPKTKELKAIESEKKKKMSEMVATYKEQGLKGLFEALKKDEVIVEEPTSAEFDAQLADAKQRAAGTKKQAEVSKPAVQAVQNEETHTTVQFIDYNDVNGVKISEIDLEERSMTEPEMKKKEEIVKSMKKGISGFKDRYGDRAKEVMYATATKQAMKD